MFERERIEELIKSVLKAERDADDPGGPVYRPRDVAPLLLGTIVMGMWPGALRGGRVTPLGMTEAAWRAALAWGLRRKGDRSLPSFARNVIRILTSVMLETGRFAGLGASCGLLVKLACKAAMEGRLRDARMLHAACAVRTLFRETTDETERSWALYRLYLSVVACREAKISMWEGQRRVA